MEPIVLTKLRPDMDIMNAERLDAFRHTKLAMVDPACNPQDFWWFPYQNDEVFSGNKE